MVSMAFCRGSQVSFIRFPFHFAIKRGRARTHLTALGRPAASFTGGNGTYLYVGNRRKYWR